MQKLSEAPEVGRRMNEKKDPSLRKGEIRSHLSRTLQTEKTFFHLAASKVARLFAKSSRLCMRIVSGTSKPTRQN